MRPSSLALLTLAAAAPAQAPGTSTPRELAGYLPAETTLLYVDLYDGQATWQAMWESAGELPAPLRGVGLLVELGVRDATGVGLGELQSALAPGQAAFALVALDRPVPVLLARVADEAAARRATGRLSGRVAVHLEDGLLCVTPREDHLARWRRFVASGAPTLLAAPGFVADRPPLPRGEGLRVYLDLERARALRQRSFGADLDPGGLFLLGPWTALLESATRLVGTLSFTEGGLRLEASLAGSAEGDPRVGRLLTGRERPLPPLPEGTLACVSLDRSLRALLDGLEEILPESRAAQARAALSTLDAIIGGASFAGELLPGLREPIALVVLDAPPSPGPRPAPAPAIELPCFALVAPLAEDSERGERLLKKGLYRFAAIASAQALQQRRPPFLPSPVLVEGRRLHVARPTPWRGPGEAPTAYNLRPTLTFTRGWAILASTDAGALALARALEGGAGETVRGDLVRLRGPGIADYLERNRGPVTVDRILGRGETPAEAADNFERVCAAIGLVDELTLRAWPEAGRTLVTIEARRRRR